MSSTERYAKFTKRPLIVGGGQDNMVLFIAEPMLCKLQLLIICITLLEQLQTPPFSHYADKGFVYKVKL